MSGIDKLKKKSHGVLVSASANSSLISKQTKQKIKIKQSNSITTQFSSATNHCSTSSKTPSEVESRSGYKSHTSYSRAISCISQFSGFVPSAKNLLTPLLILP